MTQDFARCTMQYRKDEQGNDVLLKDGKFQVMMQWEKPYMHACIDALKPFGDVLEIGFGLGYSAERIQHYKPKSHTIIEYHPEVAKYARAWAKNYPTVTIIEDTWQHALPKLGLYDCIFFDDYPLESEQQMQSMQKSSEESSVLLEQGKKILEEAEKTLPFLQTIQYSDENLRELMKEIPAGDYELGKQCARFLKELFVRKQIAETQLQKALEVLVCEDKLHVEDLKPVQQEPFTFSRTGDRLYQFLGDCLKAHMRKDSRFSCFLSSAASKYEDARFVEEVIANPWLDFTEKQITLDVPSNCAYFSGNKALVITIVKRG